MVFEDPDNAERYKMRMARSTSVYDQKWNSLKPEESPTDKLLTGLLNSDLEVRLDVVHALDLVYRVEYGLPIPQK